MKIHEDRWLSIYRGDCRLVLTTLEQESVNCVVTSPPYFGLRDYGEEDQIGLESTLDGYIDALVDVFREIRRILKPDGTIWLNLGDSYSSGSRNSTVTDGFRRGQVTDGKRASKHQDAAKVEKTTAVRPPRMAGIKPKDLLGVPWAVAFALRNDGWYLRADIVWAKPNPMPESVTDRPTRSHEFIFLLTKSERYFYDSEAVKEPVAESTLMRIGQPARPANGEYKHEGEVRIGREAIASPNRVWSDQESLDRMAEGRNLRDVWNIATQAYPGAHFAVFPPKLIEPCILAGCPKDGVVLDPFAGSGTTGMVSNKLGRRAVLIDLNAEYIEQIFERNRDMYLGL